MSTSPLADTRPDEAGRKAAPLWLVPLVVAAALFMENMDGAVIATSLPAIAADLGEDPVILKLAFTAYLVSLAIFIPVSGWCADRFGARRVFQAAIAVFTLASIGCGAATSLEELVAARALQGMGGAMMVPVGRLIILRAVPKAELVRALAWLTVPALVGPVVGPPFGGFVTTYFDWRWIFWINVPFGIAGMVLAALFMPAGRDRRPGPLDWRGFALLGSGLASLIFGFTIAGREVLPEPAPEAMMLAGAFLCLLYVVHARRAAHPLIDLGLLGVPTFLTSVGGGFLFRVGGGAIPFLLPLMLQLAFGLDAFASGSLTFVAAAGAIVMKFTAGPILRRFGFRRVLTVNALVCAAFMGAYGLFTAQTPHWLILAVLLAGGFFRSLQFTSLNAVAYADVDEAKMSQATALAAVAQQLALAIGVALAAFTLEASRAARGDGVLVEQDFAAAFFGMAVLVGLCALFHRRLRPEAGAEVSGHRR